MKQYYTIDYDLNRPSNRIVSAPLNSDFGVGVRMWRNGSAFDSDITVGGNASTGTRGGYQLFDLSTGSIPCTKELAVEVNKSSGEKYEYEDTITVKQPVNRLTPFTINVGTFLSGYEISPSNVKLFEMTSTLTPDAGGDPITETYGINDIQFYGTGEHGSGSGLWWHVKDGQWEDQAKAYHNDTIVLGVVGTRNVSAKTQNSYPKSTGTATFKLVFKFGDGEDIATNFKLNVNETDLGYIEKWSGSEPPSPWTVILGSKTFVAESTTTEEVYSETYSGDIGWIYAKQVKSLTCTYSDNGGPKQTITSFMNVQVQDDDDGVYFFCHAGDPSNGNIWYESEGGMSAEKSQIKVAGNFRTIHFPVVEGHTYEVEWKLEYDADMVFQELSASVASEVEQGETEMTAYIFQSPPAQPMILSAGQVADFKCYIDGSGEAYVTDGPYIYDLNGDVQRWSGNKWYNGENYSDYIEIDGESFFGAYIDFSMGGEYTTTFSLKYDANE